MKIHTMKECVSLYVHLATVKSTYLTENVLFAKTSQIEQYIDISDMEWANRKQFNIVVERQYREWGGSAPCMEIW